MFKNMPGSPTNDSVVNQFQKGSNQRVYFNSNNSKLKNPQAGTSSNYSKIYSGAQSINNSNMPTSSRSNRN